LFGFWRQPLLVCAHGKSITREEYIWPMGRKPKLVGERVMGWNGLKLAYSRRYDVIAGHCWWLTVQTI